MDEGTRWRREAAPPACRAPSTRTAHRPSPTIPRSRIIRRSQAIRRTPAARRSRTRRTIPRARAALPITAAAAKWHASRPRSRNASNRRTAANPVVTASSPPEEIKKEPAEAGSFFDAVAALLVQTRRVGMAFRFALAAFTRAVRHVDFRAGRAARGRGRSAGSGGRRACAARAGRRTRQGAHARKLAGGAHSRTLRAGGVLRRSRRLIRGRAIVIKDRVVVSADSSPRIDPRRSARVHVLLGIGLGSLARVGG